MKKKLTTLALTAALGLFAGFFANAAVGDIYDIVPCDENGVDRAAWTIADDPFGSGVDLYFKVRLVAREFNGANPVSRWRLDYDGLIPENIAESLYPMQIGIYVSGEQTYAKLVSVLPEGNYTTALVFMYTTKPGDFAMPIRLATAEGPAGDSISNGEYVFNPLTSYWKMSRYDADNNSISDCGWVFTADNARIGLAITDIGRAPVTDYSLEKCGMFVKTVGFSPDDESADYWRSIHENSTITGGGISPRLTITAPSEAKRTFYVWSSDESKIKLKPSGTVTVSPVTMRYDEDPTHTATYQVAKVEFEGGSEAPVSFLVEAQPGSEGETAELILSAFDHFNYSATTPDERLIDYVTATVKCIEALPASVIVECADKTITADHDYMTAKTSLAVYLSQAAETDVAITLKTTFEDDAGKTDWGNYVRFSTSANTVQTLPADNEITITIPAGSTEKRIVYVYALRGDEHTVGDGHQVKFSPYVDPAVMAAAGIQDLTAAGLWISAAKPVITTPDTTSTYEVTAGESLEINVAVEDTYADMTDIATGYQVRIKTGSTASWTTLPERFKASGEDGELVGLTSGNPPTIEYPSAGTQTSQIQVISPISGKKSEIVTFTVNVAAAKTTSAMSLDPDPDNYVEGDVVHFRIALSSQNDTGAPIYAFLVCNEDVDLSMFGGTAAKAILTDRTVAAAGSIGRQIGEVGSYADSSFTVLDGLSSDDGGQNYTFSVVLCRTKEYDPAQRLEGYATTEMLNITVYNKEPTFNTVYLNGFDAEGDGYTFPNQYPRGQDQTIQPDVSDVSYDLRHGFSYKWTASRDGQAVANGTVSHDTTGTVTTPTTTANAARTVFTTVVPDGENINECPFTYNFPRAGVWTIKIQIKDKDMLTWSPVTYSISFVVLSQPSVTVTPESSYDENAIGARFDVGLGYFDSEDDIVVKLTVTPPAGVNPGALVLDNEFKAVPAGYPALADNEYYVSFDSAQTIPVGIDSMDGTRLSSSKGFVVKAEVVSTGTSSDPTMTWAEYYLPDEEKIYINNMTPEFGYITLENTNAWIVAGGAADSYPISWEIRNDVEYDFTTVWPSGEGPGIKVSFKGCDNETTFFVGENDEWSGTFVPNFGSRQKDQTVVLTIQDKDGGIQTWTYMYFIRPSKFLTTIPNGPTGFGNSELSKKYSRTALKGGRGEGHIYVAGATFSDGTYWRQRWNCSSASAVDVYAWGYRVGAFDNGWLDNGMDLALDEAGSGTAKAATADVTAGFYPYPDEEKDSFLYAWLMSTPQTESGPPEWTLTLAPEQPSAKAEPATAYLPTATTEDESYIPVYAEAVFSKEWQPEDNLGDINQDGIPDYFAIAIWGNGLSLITTVTGAEPADGDLNDLAAANPDDDCIPGVWLSQGKLAIVLKELASYAPVGYEFNNRLELRGFHYGLNETSLTMSEPSFSEAEQKAWEAFAADNGLDPATPDLTKWSPEPRGKGEQYRMDPTMDDTDSDDMPDGWEYFFWYQAKVWAPGGDKLGEPRKGQLYVFERFNPGDIIRGIEIPAEEVLERFDPCVELDRTVKDFNPDFDHDGLTDLEELVIGTNPCHWDTDGDHMCDGWEVIHSLDPLGGSKVGNPDGDFMAYLSLKAYMAVEHDSEPDTYVFDLDNELEYGRDWDYVGGFPRTIRDVTLTAALIAPQKFYPDGEIYLYGLETDAPPVPIPPVWHWSYPMLDHTMRTSMDDGELLFRRAEYTIPEGTELFSTDHVLVHDQIHLAFGFDPRTGWNKDQYGYVADRWNPAINGELSPLDTTGAAVNTDPYTDYDEYLALRYRIDFGIAYYDDAPYGNDIWKNFLSYSTKPNIVYAKEEIDAILNASNNTENATTYDPETAANLTATANIAEYLAQAFAEAGSERSPVKGHGADTDGDGVPDGWELYKSRNPNATPADPIAVGFEGLGAPWDKEELFGTPDYLGYALEYAGTDSCNAYKDCPSIYNNHPGLHSVAENFEQGWFNKFFPTDPDNPDTDGDGILDGAEGMTWVGLWANAGASYLVAGTDPGMTFIYGNPQDSITCCVRGGGMNPCTVDTDIDGLPDPWEMQYAGLIVNASTRRYAGPAKNFDPDIDETTFTADGLNAADYAVPENAIYICGGMDATWGGDGWADPINDGNSTDPLLGTRRDVDFDHDGLQNYQEYLVQQVRHFRYDDITTPLMGRYLDEGEYNPMDTSGPLLSDHVLNEAPAFTPMMQDPNDFVLAALQNWADGSAFSVVTNAAGYTISTNEITGQVTQVPKYEVVTNITAGSGVVANKYYGTGYNYMFSTPWIEAGWRKNGYMASPIHYWDRMITCVAIQPSFMMPPAGVYVSTDPRIADTDGDGMDDYYEMFHGLNPLLGSTTAGAKDVIAEAWGQKEFYNAFWNEWTHSDFNRVTALTGLPGSIANPEPLQSAASLDPFLYPWAMGTAEADPDGDGLRNDAERITANLTSPMTTHTDPTPLWYTDASSANSYVAQYYQNTPPVSAMPFWPMLIGFDDPYSAQTPDGGYGGFAYLYAFEENEGYDTDNDWKGDGREIVRTFRAPTDPLDFTDPVRRQALYLDGDQSWVQSRSTFMRDIFTGRVPSATTVDFFKQFTAEAWIRPEKIGEQVILDRCSLYGYDAINKEEAAIRTNFRIGLTEAGRVYGMFDNDDAKVSVRADSESCQTVIGPVVPTNEWAHVALTYDGKRLVLYVNGSAKTSAPTHLIPANGVNVIVQDPTYTNAFTQTAYEAVPGAFFIGGRPLPANAGGANAFDTATITYASMNQDEWFKGYIDEVRIWDGARTETEIADAYRKHMTMADAATNRLEVYTHLMGPEADSSRNDNDGLKALTAELVQLYDFSTMPGAINSADAAQNASGFDNAVRGQLVSKPASFTENVGWWDACQTKSTIYTDYAVLPWIENTVHHLPVMDGSVVDSFVYSDMLGGYLTPASQHELQKYSLNNSAMPYPYHNYFLERYQRLFKLNLLLETNPEDELFNDLVCRYEYEVRSDFIGTADLVPMGNAYSKPCPQMWDGQGSSDLWELTGTDTDGDGIPDWWETANGLDPNDPSDWASTITWNDAEMPAWEAYLRDLARGAMPDGSVDSIYASTSDTDADGLYDWWENIYAVEQGAGGDDDGDGLSNYVEYMLSEVFNLNSNSTWIRFAPDNAFSVNPNVSDYFFRLNQLYAGEIFTDHDRIKDQWESKYLVDNDNVSPYAYDPDIDADADGWSNEAEFQSGTKPTVLASLTVDAVQMNEYPVPTIELTVSYHGKQNIGEIPVVVKAWRNQSRVGIPDAVWTLGGQGDVKLYENGNSNIVTGVKHFGMNPMREMLLHLSPGSVVPGSIKFEFKDLAWILYNLLTNDGYVSDPVTAIWQGPIIDQPRNDNLEIGDIVRQGFPDESFGTINYATGELKVDFAAFPDWFAIDGDISQTMTGNGWISVYNLQKSYVRVNWQSKLITGGSVNTYYLSEADLRGPDNNSLGHIKQGPNCFEAFYDLNQDGMYTPGEPYGFVRDVDVGWNYAKAGIELTDTTTVTPRYNLTKGSTTSAGDTTQTGGNDEGDDAATDREKLWGVPGTEDVYTLGKGVVAPESDNVRVRVVRYAVDNPTNTLNYLYAATLYDRVLDLTADGHQVLTEADILSDARNAFDLDWDARANGMSDQQTFSQMKSAGSTFYAFTNVYYGVYIGNGETQPWNPTNDNLLVKLIVRKFFKDRSYPIPVPGATTINTPAPTFSWRTGIDATYTAFRIKVTGSGFSWTSDYQLMPPHDADGVCSWTPPIRIGAIVPGGTTEFKNGGTYTWSISTYNAKFRDDAWIEGGTFLANVLTNSTDYATARVAVRYYGPSDVASSGKIRVQAFKTPDFSGEPVAEGYVTRTSDLTSTAAIKRENARIIGLKPGSYYIRAFVDTDKNGSLSFWVDTAARRFNWESWGCYCTRDLKLGTIFTPRSITVGPEYGSSDIIPVYIEDCDTDRDSLPDAWEWAQKGDLTTYGATSIDQNAGGFAMKKSLTGAITAKGALSTGLAVMTMTNLKSSRVAALLLGVNATGSDAQVNAALNNAKSDATAEPTAVAIKAIEIDRDTNKVAIKTETVGTEKGSVVATSDIYEFASGSSTLTLTCKIWHRVALGSGDWTVIKTQKVELGKETKTYEFDLGDDVDLASGFFKATLEK